MESRGLRSDEKPQDIGPLYLVTFITNFPTFRLAEFQAAADYCDVRYCFVKVPKAELIHINGDVDGTTHAQATASSAQSSTDADGSLDLSRPYALVHLANDDVARKLASRVTCIRAIWQHWASAPTLSGVQEILREDADVRAIWLPWQGEHVSWRATVTSYMRTLTAAEKRDRIEAFADVLAFRGPIRMRDPQMEWCFAEEWTQARKPSQEELERGVDTRIFAPAVDEEDRKDPQRQRLLAIHVGRCVAGKDTGGLARELIGRLNVKKRAYIGTTTMESGMSLVQAGMALAGPGKFIYDPFAGTGSLLLAAAAYGAHVLGSDIDARSLRGKCENDHEIPGFARSAQQYGLQHLFVDSLGFDITQNPLRRGGLFDAIVADPPYGVREGARRLGRRATDEMASEPFMCPDGEYSHDKADYVPPSRPYALDDLLADLLAFAAYMLVPHGRLVFWVPTMTDVEADNEGAGLSELQLPFSRDFRLVAHSLQDFGLWGRRLITLEKIEPGNDDVEDARRSLRLPSAPSHHVQRALEAASKATEKTEKRRIMATDNPDEFRNQFFTHRQRKRDAVV